MKIGSVKIVYIDHYDSFSQNVIEWLRTAQPQNGEIIAIAHDNFHRINELMKRPLPLVLSPGPGEPKRYPSSCEVADSAMHRVPILGICLGHQILGAILGGSIGTATEVLHGYPRRIQKTGSDGLLAQMPDQFSAMSYNSLAVTFSENHPAVKITARCEFGDIQSFVATNTPWLVGGIQFHPESFLSSDTMPIASAFWREASRWAKAEQN